MAAQELRWLTYLLTDLGEPPRSPPVLYVDNKAMLALCREQRLEHRTKHIALRYFLARELQQRGQLRLAYVASEANTADVFTKALAPYVAEQCKNFWQFVRDKRRERGIETTWIINADQTPLYLEMPATTTVDQTGVRSVPIGSAGYQKERVTVMLACTADRMKLRLWVFFKRKTVPKGVFPPVASPYPVSRVALLAVASPCCSRAALLPARHPTLPALSRPAARTALLRAALLLPALLRASLLAGALLPAQPSCAPPFCSRRPATARLAARSPAGRRPAARAPPCWQPHRCPHRPAHTALLLPALLCAALQAAALPYLALAVLLVALLAHPSLRGVPPPPLPPPTLLLLVLTSLVLRMLGLLLLLVGSAAAARARVERVVAVAAGVVVVEVVEAVEVAEVVAAVGVVAGVGASVAAVVAAMGVGVAVVAAVGVVAAAVVAIRVELFRGEVMAVARGSNSSVGARPLRLSSFTCGKLHIQHHCFSRLNDAWHTEFGDEAERLRWLELLRCGVDIFALDYDAILAAMYALSVSAEGEFYLCVPPDPGIEASALGDSESSLLGTAPSEALRTFTLDSGASRCFFRESTTLTPLPTPVSIRQADPSGDPVLARSSTVLPCPAVPSGSLSGLHLPSFSTNLVSTAALQDAMVTTTTPGGQRVSICTCTRTGRHLATFTRLPGSSLYTLTTKPPHVAASAQVSASGPVAVPFSCRLLSHQTLLWHHRLGHPSLPRLCGMHSRLLVSGLPMSLPPLPPLPASPCLPCDEERVEMYLYTFV
ncbi:unnamed protein product [Closterium sp. NIES-54]